MTFSRTKPHQVQWPIVARTIESVDLNFDALFDNWRRLSDGLGTVLTPVAGGIAYSTTSALALSAAGSARQVLQSGGTGVPTWTSDLYTSTTIGTAYIYRAGGTDVAVADGGTNLSSYAVGDILHATGTTTIGKLADVAIGQVLVSGGIGVVPAYTASPSLTMITIAGTPTNPTDVATKAYVDLAVAAINLDEFFTSTADALGGLYYAMTDTPAASGTVTSAAITSSTTTNIFNFITPVGHPHLDRLIAGVYDIHSHLLYAKGAGLERTTTVYCELYKTDAAGGTQVLLGTSATTPVLTTSDTFYDLYLTLAAEATLAVTDRVLLKFYAITTGGTADTTVTMTVGGAVDPHLSISINAAELDAIFVPYTGATDDTNLGTKKLTAAGLTVASGGTLTIGTTILTEAMIAQLVATAGGVILIEG